MADPSIAAQTARLRDLAGAQAEIETKLEKLHAERKIGTDFPTIPKATSAQLPSFREACQE